MVLLRARNGFFEFFDGFRRIRWCSLTRFFCFFGRTTRAQVSTSKLLTTLSWEIIWQQFFFKFFKGFPRTLRRSEARFSCFFGRATRAQVSTSKPRKRRDFSMDLDPSFIRIHLTTIFFFFFFFSNSSMDFQEFFDVVWVL